MSRGWRRGDHERHSASCGLLDRGHGTAGHSCVCNRSLRKGFLFGKVLLLQLLAHSVQSGKHRGGRDAHIAKLIHDGLMVIEWQIDRFQDCHSEVVLYVADVGFDIVNVRLHRDALLRDHAFILDREKVNQRDVQIREKQWVKLWRSLHSEPQVLIKRQYPHLPLVVLPRLSQRVPIRKERSHVWRGRPVKEWRWIPVVLRQPHECAYLQDLREIENMSCPSS